MDSGIVRTLTLVAIIGYGLFLVYNSAEKFMTSQKAKKEYLATTKKNPEKISDYLLWIVLCGVVALIAIAGLVLETGQRKDILSVAAFIFLIFWSISTSFEFVVRRSIIFDEDGFFFEQTYYRFRSVNGVELTSGMMKHYNVRLTTTAEKLQLPKKFGKMLKEKVETYRKKRKIKR